MKKIVRDSIIVIAISAFVILGIEGTLRLVYPEKAAHKESIYEFDQTYLYRLKPGVSEEYQQTPANGGQAVIWKSNLDGFRGPELLDAPDYRIMVYGDSNIHARFEKLENTYCYKLQRYLQERLNKQVEVINAGLLGQGPDQFLLRFKEQQAKYNPDLVIFHIYAGNDYGNALRNRLLEVDEDGKLTETQHPRILDFKLGGEPEFSDYWLIVKAALSINTFISKKFFKKTSDDIFALWAHSLADDYRAYKNGLPRTKCPNLSFYDFDVATDPSGEAAWAKIRLMDVILSDAKFFAHQHEVMFMVQIQPSMIDMGEKHRWANPKILSEKFPDYRPANLTDPLIQICQKHGILHFNFWDMFTNNDSDSLHYTHSHWNTKAQDMAASAVAYFIIDSSFLIPPPFSTP